MTDSRCGGGLTRSPLECQRSLPRPWQPPARVVEPFLFLHHAKLVERHVHALERGRLVCAVLPVLGHPPPRLAGVAVDPRYLRGVLVGVAADAFGLVAERDVPLVVFQRRVLVLVGSGEREVGMRTY